MKNTIKVFGNLNRAHSAKVPLLIIAIVAVIGFGMAGCEDDPPPDDKKDAFAGTWIGQGGDADGMKIIAADGSFTGTMDDHPAYRGTYTVSGNNVTITFTSINTGFMSGGADAWTAYDDIPAGTGNLPPKTVETTINGNQFSVESMTFTKQ